MRELTLENLIAVIRERQAFSERVRITAQSLLEKDLGITGDDGCELIEEIEKQFSLSFGTDVREIFGLAENENLFHSEGIGLFSFLASLFGKDVEIVKAITVGQLFEAMQKAKDNAATYQSAAR